MSSFLASLSARRACARAGLSTAAAVLLATSVRAGVPDPSYVLSAPHLTAGPGQTVTVAVRFDNTGAPIQGWSYGLAVVSPLTFSGWRHGATTLAFQGGIGPSFGALNSYPGEGVTTGVVISFTSGETLPPGSGYELQLVDVTIPGDAASGTVFPLDFVTTLGSPPVDVVIVVSGSSVEPVVQPGSITVGSAGPFCFGDGSGAACPCGNTSPVGANSGCLNSLGVGGRLVSSGLPSLAADSVVLSGSNMPNSSALYFQGLTPLGGGTAFGDGLRCAGGATVRLGTKLNASGASSYPQAGDLSVSQRGGVTSPGQRTYQIWYRNAAVFCTSATFNLTNGVAIVWSA